MVLNDMTPITQLSFCASDFRMLVVFFYFNFSILDTYILANMHKRVSTMGAPNSTAKKPHISKAF